MCIVCEHELWDEHRALEREFFKVCKRCKKFPGASSQGTCYHCYVVGSAIDECPKCEGKPGLSERPKAAIHEHLKSGHTFQKERPGH